MSSTTTSNLRRRLAYAGRDRHERNRRAPPPTIDNGEGELLTFLGVRYDAGGREVLEVENRVQPGSGPPMHAHLPSRKKA